MIRFTAISILLLFLTAESFAQRSLQAAPDFESYRPVGDIRGWTYVAKDSAIGQLISTIKQEIEIDGIDGFEMNQVLQFDYNKIGTDRRQRIRSSHYVSRTGAYLGDNMVLDLNDETEELELERDGDKLKGYYTRGDNKIEREIEYDRNGFAADILFLDMYENFLAMRDIKVGDTIYDSVFVPQTMLVEKVQAYVEHFGLVTLYNQVRDSVFLIRFTQPQVMIFYFSPKKQLVKAEFLAQQMKAYLDIARRVSPEALGAPSFGFTRFVSLIPNYGVYLFIGVLALFFLAGHQTRNPNLYVFILVGAAGYIIAVFTQVPFQTYLAESVFLKKVSGGGSYFFWAIVPALPAGIIQEFIKLGIILGIRKYLKTERSGLLVFGAAAGAGFGIAEASYIVSQLPTAPVWSIALVERGFFILFHATTGVLLSLILFKNTIGRRLILLVTVILANCILRYLPIFVQSGSTDAKLIYILIPIIPILLLAYSVHLIKANQQVLRH